MLERPPDNVTPSPRARYLNSIGLNFDSFAYSVAEREIAEEVESAGRPEAEPFRTDLPKELAFFRYFSPPQVRVLETGTLIQALRQPMPVFVYGATGSGKTTLRLALEAERRAFPDRTLAVTHLVQAEPEIARWGALAQSLAIDLFIQIIEQYNPSSPFLDPGKREEQIKTLSRQLVVGGEQLRRLIERFLREPEPESLMGFGALWRAVSRPAIRYVARPDSLVVLLAEVLDSPESRPQAGRALPDPYSAVLEGFEAVHQWGYEQIDILVDDADLSLKPAEEAFELLRPIVDELVGWQKRGVRVKFFLPLTIRSLIQKHMQLKGMDRQIPWFEAVLEWSEPELRNLLVQRFRAAGSRRSSLDDLAGPGMEGKLETLLLRSSLGSPRRLLNLFNSLINAHAQSDPGDPLLTSKDWERMRAGWSFGPPQPLAFNEI